MVAATAQPHTSAERQALAAAVAKYKARLQRFEAVENAKQQAREDCFEARNRMNKCREAIENGCHDAIEVAIQRASGNVVEMVKTPTELQADLVQAEEALRNANDNEVLPGTELSNASGRTILALMGPSHGQRDCRVIK